MQTRNQVFTCCARCYFNPNLRGTVILTPCWFSLNNSEIVKDVTLAFCGIQFSNISLGTCVPNLVFLTHAVSRYWAKFRRWYFRFPDFCSILEQKLNKNCHNSRTSNDVDFKLGPVTKLDKRNTIRSINFTMTSDQQILKSLSFFQFMANLGQSRSRILDAWSVKLTFLLTVTF